MTAVIQIVRCMISTLLALCCLALCCQTGVLAQEKKKSSPPQVEDIDTAREADPADARGSEDDASSTASTDEASAAPAEGAGKDDSNGKPAVSPGFVGPLPPPREEPGVAGNAATSSEKHASPVDSGEKDVQTGNGVNVAPERPAVGPTSTGPMSTGPASTGPASSGAPPAAGAAPGGIELPGVPKGKVGFPDFAEGQPGFIPDGKTPEDLFSPAPPTELAFETQLGTSQLPEIDAQTLIMGQAANPAMNLPQNFARIVVPSGSIQGSTETKQFHIEGGLTIYYSEITITADIADIDEKEEIAILKGNVAIVDPKYTMKADELRILFNDKRFEATGFVQFTKKNDPAKAEPDMSRSKKDRVRDYFAGQQFELFCNSLFYNWDSKEMTALGGVRMVHPSFNGTLERLDYNDKTKLYEMNEEVELVISNYDWIFKTKVTDEKDEKKLRALTDGDTKVVCERMVYSEETSIGEFYAKSGEEVSFEQPKRSIKASYIEVNDDTKDFYAEGQLGKPAVYTQTDGEWLYQAEVIKKEAAPADVQNALKASLTSKSNTITFNYDRKRIELLGGVTIEGSGTTIQAAELVQDETAKFFLLRGNVFIKPNPDSEIHAAQVYVDTENDVLTFVGLVQGQAKSDELPTTEAAGETGVAGTPGAAGGAPGTGVQPGVFRQQNQPGQLPGRGTSNTNIAEKE